MKISISRKQITKFFSYLIIGLFLITIVIVVLKINFPSLIKVTAFQTIETFLHFNGEANFVAWLSSLILLISSILLFLIAFSKKQSKDLFSKHWKWLAIIFLIMAIDETAQIHESFSRIFSVFLPDGYWLFDAKFAFFLIGVPLTLVLGFIFLKFLLHLPKKTKRLFIIAGAIFLGGALGLEFFSNYLHHIHTHYFWFRITQSMEEIFELSGIVIFNYAILGYLKEEMEEKEVDLVLLP